MTPTNLTQAADSLLLLAALAMAMWLAGWIVVAVVTGVRFVAHWLRAPVRRSDQ
jgi:hypothetical protein